jgi:hypothetical protein
MNALRGIVAALAACVAVAWLASPSPALFVKPQLEEVPIAQLVDNLEKLAAKDPKDAKIRFNLARAYAMAYAAKVDTVQMQKGKDVNGVWFGFTPKHVPFTPKMTDDEAKNKLAQENLAKAIERYRETMQLDPKMLPARLGLAWCLDQAKKKDEAIKEYRGVIDDGWMKEKELKSLGLGGNSITIEAAGYLIPLLDAEKDKAEISELQERMAKLKKLPRPVTPIVVPLRDGLTAYDMVNTKARVRFDADGHGFNEQWNWFTKDAGILVYDPHHKGRITSALQWFGNVTFWMFWDNGYEALRALDDNGDGVLTGKELDGLALWIDANGNGVCEAGAVKTLAELGIVAVSCRYEIDTTHPDAIAFCRVGVTFRDGTTRPTFDVVLRKW